LKRSYDVVQTVRAGGDDEVGAIKALDVKVRLLQEKFAAVDILSDVMVTDIQLHRGQRAEVTVGYTIDVEVGQ